MKPLGLHPVIRLTNVAYLWVLSKYFCIRKVKPVPGDFFISMHSYKYTWSTCSKKPISDTDSNWIFKETSLKVLKFDESYRIILLCITRLFLDEKLKFLQKFKLNCLNFTNDKFIICTADLYVLWLLFWQRQLYTVQFVKKLLTKLEKERETRAGIESHHYPARGFYWNN